MIDVLVVDDDFNVARIHSGHVNHTPGFRVVGTARTGAAAVDAIREHQPDLVLLDLYLPDMSGLEVLTRSRSERQDCDVLVVSAAKDTDTVRSCLRQGVVDYLLKPFNAKDLRRRLESYATDRARLAATTIDTQADVDRMLRHTTSGPATTTLPKGLSSHTASLVDTALRAAPDTLSATECAAEVGISRVSARLYLEYLHATGRAEVTLRYHTAGRPERRYRGLG